MHICPDLESDAKVGISKPGQGILKALALKEPGNFADGLLYYKDSYTLFGNKGFPITGLLQG